MTIKDRADEFAHKEGGTMNRPITWGIQSYIQGAEDQQEIMMQAFRTFLATFNGAAPASYVQREFEKGMENRLKYQQEEPDI